ncbi:hypothetical protein GCM10010174_04140 [Kutzneria viridogrisea]|uniref:Cell division protein FtsB n=1 Tax=Kutzneria viridogrisea TaxID=47990 RepID=A0ABR6BSH6_9PSEU|nr:cell division protein FtsB [Kutzneria viridogrisea]
MAEREHGRETRRRGDSDPAARRADRARRPRREQRAKQEQPQPPARRPAGGRARSGSGAGTGGAFRLSATRRAAVLAMVVCALALTVALPLRTYLTQHAQVQSELDKQTQLKALEQQLEQRKSQLADPAQVEAEARRRLRMVMPGETPYTVQLPGDGQQSDQQTSPQQQTSTKPWYAQLWDSITGSGS